MRIPRQSDRSRAPRAERLDGAADLRARRRHLVTQLRGVGYWQRLVQARTDLQVAGLLYAAPVPTAVAASSWPATATGGDVHLTTLPPPPQGLDLDGLLGGAPPQGPGAQLDRLRHAALVLLRHSRALQEELGTVTAALHASLACDGADHDHPDDGCAAAADGTAALAGERPGPA